MISIIETIKQNVKAESVRIKRFEKRIRFYKYNNVFKNNLKNNYMKMVKSNINVDKPPTVEEIQAF